MKFASILLTATALCAGTATFVATPAEAATLSRSCPVDNIAVIDGRMHIKCSSVPGVGHTQAIYYFALPLSEPAAKIQSIIALAIESKRINKPLTLWFDMDDYKSVPGCLGSDCRRLQGIALE